MHESIQYRVYVVARTPDGIYISVLFLCQMKEAYFPKKSLSYFCFILKCVREAYDLGEIELTFKIPLPEDYTLQGSCFGEIFWVISPSQFLQSLCCVKLTLTFIYQYCFL